MSWTDERIGLLKRMWKEGKSAAEIAKTLGKGVTRNAVIGKAHRMSLSGRPSPIKNPPPSKKDLLKKDVKNLKKNAVPSAGALKNPQTLKEVEELKNIGKDVVPPGGGVALVDLTERMCKWPIGDPREADFTFCGRNIRIGTPYCPEHAAMAYQSSSRNRHAPVAAAAAVAVASEDKEEEAAEGAVVEVDDEEEEEEAVS